ncbi:MAG: hypothetical protein LBD70_01835, partial [Bifidobacteriaceae bacterium]|nr:hypothetical protein [Bifidobacteriaceae bacterium]
AVGALRQTTVRPQLLAHPDTIALQGDHRVRGAAEARIVMDAPLTWAILDCGDPFAVGAEVLKAQPDVPTSAWLAVTSALRYGDSMVWDLLASLAAGAEPVALVVNRLPDAAWPAIAADVRRRLAAAGLEDVAVFSLPEVEGSPSALPAELVAEPRQWLRERFPAPERRADAPDLRAALDRLAARAAELAQAQAVHEASVDLLRSATEGLIADAAEAAADFEPGPVDSRLTEVWLDQLGPEGPFANVDFDQARDPERRKRWASGSASVGRAVSDAVAADFRRLLADARAAMVSLWQGADVPEGTRALIERRRLAEVGLPEELAGGAGHGLWVEGLKARLRGRRDAATARAVEAFGRSGLVALAQAAALGAEGPAGLLAGLLADQSEALIEDARESLREARAGIVRLALAAFAGAVREVERTASDTLAWSADRLAFAAKKVGS